MSSRHSRPGDQAGQSRTFAWLIAPLGVLYGVFAVLPLGMILRFSVANGFENFRNIFGSPLLLRVATNTLVISLATTIIALALAIPVAAVLWRSRRR